MNTPTTEYSGGGVPIHTLNNLFMDTLCLNYQSAYTWHTMKYYITNTSYTIHCIVFSQVYNSQVYNQVYDRIFDQLTFLICNWLAFRILNDPKLCQYFESQNSPYLRIPNLATSAQYRRHMERSIQSCVHRTVHDFIYRLQTVTTMIMVYILHILYII